LSFSPKRCDVSHEGIVLGLLIQTVPRANAYISGNANEPRSITAKPAKQFLTLTHHDCTRWPSREPLKNWLKRLLTAKVSA
jgi:hypothetical protein